MMKVLCVASEAVPFIKTGGLADVIGSLPQNCTNIRWMCGWYCRCMRIFLKNLPANGNGSGVERAGGHAAAVLRRKEASISSVTSIF
jgi:hypothetical protein